MGLSQPIGKIIFGIVLRQVWPTCVWFKTFFFFHHFFSHVRGAWRRIKTPLMLRITLIHGICIYTLPSNISSLIVKAFEIITSRNPPRLLVHQCQLESSRQKTDASCDRTQSRLSNHLPFLLIKAITTPSPLREQEV